MPTASKVQFRLDALRAEALKAADARIERAQAELDQLGSEESFQEEVQTWRAAQLRRMVALLDTGDLTNDELARFRVEPIPERSSRDRRLAEGAVRAAWRERSAVVAKSSSLVPDEDGNVGLTKNQLAEFFGL